MKISSSKAKGRRLQNYVRDILRRIFIDEWTKYPRLEPDDIKSQTMGMTGEDIVLSPRARGYIPYSFECKNVEKLNIWDSIKQCESNCGDRCPVLVFKRNGTDVYAVLKFENFVNLIKERN